jgi:hypothetical protein
MSLLARDRLTSPEDNFCIDIIVRRDLGSRRWPEAAWYRKSVVLTMMDAAGNGSELSDGGGRR